MTDDEFYFESVAGDVRHRRRPSGAAGVACDGCGAGPPTAHHEIAYHLSHATIRLCDRCWDHTLRSDPLWDWDAVAAHFDVTPHTVRRWHRAGVFLDPDADVRGTPVWRASRVIEWQPPPRGRPKPPDGR